MSRFHTMDKFQVSESKPAVRTIRSVTCNGVVGLATQSNTCRTCRTMTFSTPDKENISPCTGQSNDDKDDKVERIKHLLNHANPELVSLFIEQSNNISRDPRGRRWSKSFIGTCLQIYNRSPHSYELLLSSKILILPSSSTLVLYKNKLKQDPGFDHTMFEWMLQEAERKGIPDEGMVGGLIFDEMSIQSDIQISKNGDVVELVGFTDLGEEGDKCNILRKGNADNTLGTHILQMLFLGVTGFRFPFAHFVTDGIQAGELYSIFWKAVQHLWTYRFKVKYTCMDGAVCNRSLMHLCVGDNSNLNYNFIAKCPTTSQTVIFTMDVSHVFKKIRNNILKSGINQTDTKQKFTRNLTLQNGSVIQWQMFVDSYKWDTQNGLQLNRKLSNEHIFPDNQQKMRNHLAEEVLNIEMLNLFNQYKNTLGEKGQILNGVIEFLEKTSQMISIFRDFKPIATVNDPRLVTLSEISTWFLEWEKFGKGKNTKSKTVLMSQQCHEDIQACLQGFVLLCQTVLKQSSNIHITPALVNSDVIENIFNQQRSTYNGANSNPNALQYRRTINSILTGQNVVSRKSNAGNSSVTEVPFTVQLKKKAKIETPAKASCSSSNIKVIRV